MSAHGALRRLALAGAAAALVLGASACGDSTDEAPTSQEQYCQAWVDLETALQGLDDVDLINGGMDALRTQIAAVRSAADELEAAADAQVAPAVDAFAASVEDLATTATTTSLPVDRREQVRASVQAVDDAWQELATSGRASCPSASTSG